MTTAFGHCWNLTYQVDPPTFSNAGDFVLQKTLADVIPSPLPLPVTGAYLLHPGGGDYELLAALTQSAYGLDGAALPELRLHMRRYFLTVESHPLLDSSWMCFVDGAPVSACLIARPRGSETPRIFDLMTARPWQGKGLAMTLLQKSLHALVEKGYTALRVGCPIQEKSLLQRLEQFGFTAIHSELC